MILSKSVARLTDLTQLRQIDSRRLAQRRSFPIYGHYSFCGDALFAKRHARDPQAVVNHHVLRFRFAAKI
jgi:hypothetical protein